jgi:hypothetical protein
MESGRSEKKVRERLEALASTPQACAPQKTSLHAFHNGKPFKMARVANVLIRLRPVDTRLPHP